MRIGLAGVGRIGQFHAATLMSLDAVQSLVVADAQPGRAPALAAANGYDWAANNQALLAAGIDALVIATATPGHASLLRAGIRAGVPTFCEKPVAATLQETLALDELAESSSVPVQVGFQRRFDRGYRRARAALAGGELGFVHTVRANTHDQAPPDPAYIPTSGGILRDCNVHDFDAIRFVTGREVITAYATGANKGADFFAAGGDVDTAAAVLTLDDGTLALVSSTRYNGAGHDVRMEVMGSRGSIGVGLDASLALDSAEGEHGSPSGPRHHSFMDRFAAAYRAELTEFVRLTAAGGGSSCTVRDALEAFRIAEACDRSRREGRVVQLAEIPEGRGQLAGAARVLPAEQGMR